LYELKIGLGLVVHRKCFALYHVVKNNPKAVIDKAVELAGMGCNDTTDTTGTVTSKIEDVQ
jgi:hypothetical protein